MRLLCIVVLVSGVLHARQSPGGAHLVEVMVQDPLGGAAGMAFGFSLDMQGARLAVGSPTQAIHVFDGSGASDSIQDGSGHFAVDLALSDDFLVADLSASAVRIYRRRGDTWDVDEDLQLSGNPGGLDLDGRTLAVQLCTGRPQTEVIVYERNDLAWFGSDVLRSDRGAQESFGFAVAIDGDWMIIGAPEAAPGEGADAKGAAYVYHREGGRWVRFQRLQPEGLSDGAFFGGAVDVQNELLVVSANEDRSGGSAFVYAYDRGRSVWALADCLLPRPGQKDEEFGADVAIRSECVYVGAPNTAVRAFEHAGRVYEYTAVGEDISPWKLSRRIIPSNFFEARNFGRTLAGSGDFLAVSAFLPDPHDPNAFTGLVFLYSSF